MLRVGGDDGDAVAVVGLTGAEGLNPELEPARMDAPPAIPGLNCALLRALIFK